MNEVRPWQRLTRRLPLIAFAMLCAVIAGMSWAAYIQIRRATLDANYSHLENGASQIASMLDAQLRRLRNDLAGSARDSSLRPLVMGRSAQPRVSRVSSTLAAIGARGPQIAAVSVLDRTGKLLATTGVGTMERVVAAGAFSALRDNGVSPLAAVHDTLTYSIAAPVMNGRDTLGFLVATRRLSDGSSSEAIGKLLGPGTRLLVGNARGDLWTDLVATTDGPPRTTVSAGRGVFIGRDARTRIGSATRLAAAPWVVWVERSRDEALAPARGFIIQLGLIALISVLAGSVGVWLVVYRTIRPLSELRMAAGALAAGGMAAPVRVRRSDEIGGLARTFNRMAEGVHEAERALKERADALERRNQELHESESRYRQLVEQAPDAVLVHRDGEIVFANARALRVLGAAESDALVGRSVFDLVDDADRAEAVARTQAIRESGQPSKPTELRLRRLDGTPIVAEVNGSPVLFDGMPCVQTLARDISERKALEAQLLQSQKMDAVGRLAGGIAHDFNNLLTVINTYAEFLLNEMPADSPQREDAEEIKRAGASAARLTRQMLAFSRKQVLARTVLDLNDAIGGMAGMLERVLGDQIEVVADLRPNLDTILADAGQLEQVLLNLAVNARDAMPKGGTLRIQTGQVVLDDGFEAQGHQRLIPAGNYVMLAVSDTGSGMTDEVKSHIFEPFYTTKDAGKGTGLGLAMVYGIVKQSDGFIWVYSEPGRGSSFKIYLPAYAAGGPASLQGTGEFLIPSQDSATILLVEDDAMVRAAVRRILERSPHVIVEAEGASQAIARFQSERGRVDLLITDMMMPDMTGAELIRELRERNPILRAIIMSGYSEEITAREWRLPPNALFIEKPVSPNRLLRAVADVLAGDFTANGAAFDSPAA